MAYPDIGLPKTIVYVKSPSDMPTNPVSTVQYWIDYAGLLEVNEITVPPGGLFLHGTQSDLTGIGSTADNFTLFSGSSAGNVFIKDLYLTVSGSGSRVFDLADNDGTNAVEFSGVNFYDCSSLGELGGYRQFSMVNTGMFGGSPELTLSGSMNGIFIDTCLAFGLDSGFSGVLFKAGPGLELSSRFRSNMRVDLPASASFCDFGPTNFLDSSLCQMNGGQYSREGVVNSGDNNFFPNLDPEDIAAEWRDNNGLRNTHEGGRNALTTPAATTVLALDTFYDAAGVWTASDLQHFSSPVNGQLRNDGKNPQEFVFVGSFTIEGGANDLVSVKIVKWDNSASTFVDVFTAVGQVFSLPAVRDVAVINVYYPVSLEVDDYVKIQLANGSTLTNLTIEAGSFFQIVRR